MQLNPYVYSYIKPRRFTPRVNFGQSIAANLCFAALFNEIGSQVCHSSVSGVPGAFAGSSKPNWNGGKLNFPGGLNTVASLTYGTEQDTIDLARNVSNPVSFMFRFTAPATVAGGIACRNDSNSVGAGWQIEASTTRLAFLREGTSTNLKQQIGINASQKYIACITFDGSNTAANCKIYLDGAVQTSVLATDGAGTAGSDSGQTLFIGKNNFNGVLGVGTYEGSFDFFYIWRRVLSQPEVKYLAANPFAIFNSKPVLSFGIGSPFVPPPVPANVGPTVNVLPNVPTTLSANVIYALPQRLSRLQWEATVPTNLFLGLNYSHMQLADTATQADLRFIKTSALFVQADKDVVVLCTARKF